MADPIRAFTDQSRAADSLRFSVDPDVFKTLQAQIDDDTQVREELRGILKDFDRHCRSVQLVLARAHAVSSSTLAPDLQQIKGLFQEQQKTMKQLEAVASRHPYYKYNSVWSRELQNASFYIVFAGWLGAFSNKGEEDGSIVEGRLMTVEEVGDALGIPANVKDQDVFHLSLEEYLHSLVNLVEELARLAVNSVTLGDYRRPVLISRFIKDLHAGFQLLNLKNDSLRRRSDGLKYQVKRVEDVLYDLRIRSLLEDDP